ncbi:hypothetical protein QM467_00660 [Rhodoblastus sp. 17X3]|uniref:hypothetical protein n=1 Tax=Rhodoblastus sp. 17X3 TaxID=3047026 RepID=UPI0024B77F6F|nr:hypothetical protein [Rhodoblastus sp. 17X3]MDI9846562.1 hypothetical protein [Rhodoblastus sp. 17X3]
MTSVPSEELATKAREESHSNLAMAMHYARLAQGHLEIADDAGAIWDLQCFADHARAALREFKTVRAVMAAPVEMCEAAE